MTVTMTLLQNQLIENNVINCKYSIFLQFGVWRSLVARCVRDAEVAGSSPATPTNDFRELRNIKLPLFFHWYGFRDGLC